VPGLLDELQPRRRPGQARALAVHRPLELVVFRAQQDADVLEAGAVGHQVPDLAQREPEVLEDEESG
jgi:hypothetical protein